MDATALEEVKAEFLNDEGWKKTSPLDRDKVLSWMHSQDLEVLGAVHQLLFVKEHLSRVISALSFQECFAFRKHYYERCLREYSIDKDNDWEWADWGWQSAHFVVYWFYELWKDKTVPRAVLFDLKNWLAGLLREGVQESLLSTAVYDHLLSHKKIAKMFEDWRDDPGLRAMLQQET